MTTTYGTISTLPSPDSQFLSHTRQTIRSQIRTRRPWKGMVSFSVPEGFNAALKRIQTNTSYFQKNYAIIVLLMIFISLLWNPVSLIVFMIVMAAWLYLYFLRNDPIVLFAYVVDERISLAVLSVLTVVVLLMTHAIVFVAGLVVGLAAVVAHGVFRRTNDLVFDMEDGVECGTDRLVGLKETASASFSSSL